MSIFSNLFNWIGKLFTKIWRAFKVALPYILIACALWVGLVGPLSLGWLGLTTVIDAGWVSALFFMGASYLVAPEETTAVVTRVASAVGDSAQTVAKEAGEVGSAVGDALGSTLSSFFSSSGLVWVAIAVGGYLLLSGDRKDRETDRSAKVGGGASARQSTKAANSGSYQEQKRGKVNAISNKQVVVGKYSNGVGSVADRTVAGRG